MLKVVVWWGIRITTGNWGSRWYCPFQIESRLGQKGFKENGFDKSPAG
jgi:hypothetical protein